MGTVNVSPSRGPEGHDTVIPMTHRQSTKQEHTAGLQQALAFIRHCRTTSRADATGQLTHLEGVVETARSQGFEFAPEDLRQAFTLDYRMRLEVYRKRSV